jgi:phage terminase small subunit
MAPRSRRPSSEPASEKLTPKQEAFAKAYVETGNASEAYRRAYDAENTKDNVIHVKAAELLKHGKVSVRIAELQAEHQKRHEVTVDRVVKELSLIGFSNMLDYMTVSEDGGAFVDLSALTREQAAAIGELTTETYVEGKTEDGEEKRVVKRTKVKLSDKRAALVDLGKYLGMFVQKHEHTGKDGKPLVPEAASPRDLAAAVLGIIREGQPSPVK